MEVSCICIGESAPPRRGGVTFFHCAEESVGFNLGVFHGVGRMTTEKGGQHVRQQ